MEVIQLATPAHFARGRVERVGLHQNRLFLAFRAERELEVWAVHCLVPCSWHRLFRQQFHELFYVHCAISAEQGALFALVAAFFENETLDGGIAIFRYQLASQQLDEFVLDPEEAPNFEEVTLERVGLSCGRAEGQLFLHDRTMVTGRIPFWSIQLRPDRCFAQMGGPSGSTPLLKMTFSIRPQHIEDEQQLCAQCTRFPVLLDGDSRTMMRITNDYQVFVHDTADGGCWQQLEASKQTALDLSSISVRGIAETFGHNWHRFSAIESKLSIFTDADCCIFKVFQHGVHHFFRFSASLEHKTYMLEHCSAAKLDKRLETLCFVCCSAARVAFVNKHLVGFVPIQPLSLRELCFWAMQKMFANKTQGKGSSQVWSGGRTARQFQTMFNINKGLEIVD